MNRAGHRAVRIPEIGFARPVVDGDRDARVDDQVGGGEGRRRAGVEIEDGIAGDMEGAKRDAGGTAQINFTTGHEERQVRRAEGAIKNEFAAVGDGGERVPKTGPGGMLVRSVV